MSKVLTPDEKAYLDETLLWDQRQRSAEMIVVRIAMTAGAGLIAVSMLLTALNLRDTTIRAVLLPGVLGGLVLVVASLLGRRWIRDRHQMASIARKLTEGS